MECVAKIKISKTSISTKPLMCAIGRDIREVIHSRFRTSMAPDGSKWAGITHRAGKPLLLTGSLMNSFKCIYTDNIAIVGTSDIRARLHQYGGVIKAKNKPYLHFKIGDDWVKVKQVKIKARPFAGFTQEQIERYQEMATKYLEKSLGGRD